MEGGIRGEGRLDYHLPLPLSPIMKEREVNREEEKEEKEMAER